MEILKECFFYVVFIYLLAMVSFGNRDPNYNKLYNSLYQEFHDAVYYPDDGVVFEEVQAEDEGQLSLTSRCVGSRPSAIVLGRGVQLVLGLLQQHAYRVAVAGCLVRWSDQRRRIHC